MSPRGHQFPSARPSLPCGRAATLRQSDLAQQRLVRSDGGGVGALTLATAASSGGRLPLGAARPPDVFSWAGTSILAMTALAARHGDVRHATAARGRCQRAEDDDEPAIDEERAPPDERCPL